MVNGDAKSKLEIQFENKFERLIVRYIIKIITRYKVSSFIQIARAREMFLWFGTFYLIAGTGMIMGFAK